MTVSKTRVTQDLAFSCEDYLNVAGGTTRNVLVI